MVVLGWKHGMKLKDDFILTELFKWLISLLILIVKVMIIMKTALPEN